MRKRTYSLALAALIAGLPSIAGTVPALAAPTVAASPSTAGTGGKGPVGWDVYRRLDRAAELRTGVQARQFSSFDRSGGNDDGFAGTYSCLRTTADGCVIAERAGAGEIDSMWFTRDYGAMTNNGRILIELDGKKVLDANLQDVVDGKLGAPWAWPLVGNGDDTAGGSVIKVPMPYRQSMRITVQNNPQFFHVDYREFSDSTGVSTFDPSDKAEDVIAKLRGFGLADPKPAAQRAVTSRKDVDIAAGGRTTPAHVHGPGQITGLRLRLPQVHESPQAKDDGRAYTGGSSFTATIDPANDGVRITRRYDPHIGHQHAKVLVDGVPVGEWSSGDATADGVWADQSIKVPAHLTKGKSRITVTNQFVSSDQDVNEFRYDVASKAGGDWSRTDVLDLGPGHPGEEHAHNYTITAQSWQGSRTARYPTDAADVAASDAVLENARLRITFDGNTTVDSPIGEFFGSGLGDYDTRTLMYSIDASGWLSAWWPMPFAEDAVVQLVNGSGKAIKGGTLEVTSVHDPSVANRLRPTGDLGYFHATSSRGKTQDGKDWTFLDTQGRGVFYGVTHSMRGLIPSGNRRDYLEGDERVYVDGAASPAVHGTGTEDFYESGWYFRDGTTYAMPLAGNPAYELDGDGCQYDCTGAYRQLIGDAVPFGSSLRYGIEHGPADNEPADYSSTAYWYGQATYDLRRSDAVEMSDAAGRAAHGYTASGETTAPVTSSYEGDNDNYQMTRTVASTQKAVSFRMAVAQGNRGVRLTRIGDQAKPYQSADVFVDGKPAGRWTQPLGNTSSRWLEDSFDIPAALTAGKKAISIRVVPVDGSPAWTAARYETVSRVLPFTDKTAPGAVSGLRATGGEETSIALQWASASDDVGVAKYQVYASTDPNVPVGPHTLVAETPVTAFQHSGLGIRQQWYYRVRAVDGAGHAGPVSAPVSAKTGSTEVVEGESLLPAVSSDAPVEAQANCCGLAWSNNAQLWFRPTAAGQKAVFHLDVPADGTYDISAVFTKASDYGIATLAIDGTQLGQPLDGYHSPEVVIAPPQTYQGVHLTKGTHTLTLTVTGKNADSVGLLAGLDVLRLKLTDQ
jgi:hypothetical protein